MKTILILLAAMIMISSAMAVVTPTQINPSQINWDKPIGHNIDMGSYDILNFSYVDANVTMAADLHNLTDWMAANDTRDSVHEALYGVDATVKDNLTVWDTTETNVLDVNTTASIGGDLTMASAMDINMSGASVLRGVTGTFTGAVSGTSITGSGAVQGEQLTSTDDARINDTLTTDVLVVNKTTDINGDTTTDNITVDANKNVILSGTGSVTAPTFIGNVKIPDFFSIGVGRIVDTNYTYSAGGKMDSIVMLDARSYNSTLTLLPAASAPGNLTIVKLVYAPGTYFARINVTADEHINGKNLIYTTDDASTFLPSITLWSSGASWYVVDAYGTWTSADG